jgi:hypothetical protein
MIMSLLSDNNLYLRFEVFAEVRVQIVVLWVVASCIRVGGTRIHGVTTPTPTRCSRPFLKIKL